MCYSIMVETALDTLAREFAATIDYPSFQELYTSRNEVRSQIKIPSALDLNFTQQATKETTPIRTLISDYQQHEGERLQQKIAAKQTLIATLEAELKTKGGKGRQEKLATAQRMLSKLSADHSHLSKPSTSRDSRIFMYSYAPGVIVNAQGAHQLVPLRYQLRPAGSQKEIPSHINCFNARVDKLEDRHNWQRLFMHRHAALLVKSFYEWVPDPQEAGKSAQVEFFPLEGKPLWVPALWDEWCAPNGEYRIRSFAILTREPPAEIQAVGHDRCPVFPRHDLLKTWLHPEQYRREEYYQLFNQLEPVSYGHRFLSLL